MQLDPFTQYLVSQSLQQVLGPTGKQLAGIAGQALGPAQDWLTIRRIETATNQLRGAYDRLRKAGIEPEEPSLSVITPLLDAAADETREEVAEIFAKLIAAAMDPSRANAVTRSMIEVTRALEPLDALVLTAIARDGLQPKNPSNGEEDRHEYYARHLQRSKDEVLLAFERLELQGLFRTNSMGTPHGTVKLREFTRVVLKDLAAS